MSRVTLADNRIFGIVELRPYLRPWPTSYQLEREERFHASLGQSPRDPRGPAHPQRV
jgi:hypothetical protein